MQPYRGTSIAPVSGKDPLKKEFRKDSPILRLAKIFRSGNIVRHHFQAHGPGRTAPKGVAQAFFKNVHNFQQNNIPGYSAYDRFARYSDYAEMESYPILNQALNIIADEATQKDENGKIIEVISDNQKIKETLTSLFNDVLHLNGKPINKLVRNTCKYGDGFYLIDATEENGVVGLIQMPANQVEREEGFDPDDLGAIRYRWTARDNVVIPNAYVAHFRIDGNDLFYPYGQSVIEAARRPWRQLVLLEDAMMVYRITRAPERRVFFLDIQGTDPENIEYVVNKFNESIKKNKVVDETGKIDLRYGATLPVWKETPIPLMDGRTITIEQLAEEHEEGKENWVYSVQDKTLASVPGKVVWCGKNYTANRMIKVWLDDNTWIMTAPEHPFLVFNEDKTKSFSVNAEDLEENMSLVPLYRELHEKKICNGYERVWCHKSKKYKFTHRVVGDTILSEEKSQINNSTDWKKNRYLVVHHKDFNKLNNDPKNLQWLGNVDHLDYHKEVARKNITAWNKSDEKKRRVSKRNKERDSVQHMRWYNGSDLHKEHNEIRKKAQLKSWSEGRKSRMNTVSRLEFTEDAINRIYKISKQILEENPKLSRDKFGKLLNENQEFLDISKECHNGAPKGGKYQIHIRTLLRKLEVGYTEFKKIALNNGLNHKVLKIEEVFETDDVYCMTVVGPNGEDDRHNFAAASFDESGKPSKSAIFLKNSVEEDYIIPVRGGDSATRIETLPGGQNVGDIEDIEFIRANLFASLGIPKAYLTFDQDVAAKQTLTQEDIRFARTIAKIQQSIVNELVKIAMIHLYIKGHRGKDLVDFRIKMSNPSTVSELQKNELWRSRMDLVLSAGEGVFDTEFIYKNFLNLSDETIDKVRKGQILDKMFQSKLIQIENAAGMMGPGDLGMGGMGGMGMGGGMMGGMGGGLGGGLGGGMDMGGAGMGLPMGESKEKDGEVLSEKNIWKSEFERTSEKRGVEEIPGIGAEEETFDDDPADVAGLRRTISKPLGARESVDPKKLIEHAHSIINEYSKIRSKARDELMSSVTGIRPVVMSGNECSSIGEQEMNAIWEDVGLGDKERLLDHDNKKIKSPNLILEIETKEDAAKIFETWESFFDSDKNEEQGR